MQMRVTYLLSIAIIVVFGYTVLGVQDLDAFYDAYGFSGANLLERPYVLITSIFLHGGIDHLLANLFVLLFFGLAVEKETGPLRMLGVFLLGAIAGDLLSLAVYPWDAISIGASAGIFALVGLGMLVRPMDMSFYPLVMPIPLLFLGVAYALYNAYGFFFLTETNVSYIAHFGGLIVGLAAGFIAKGLRKGLLLLIAGVLGVAAAAIAWVYLQSVL